MSKVKHQHTPNECISCGKKMGWGLNPQTTRKRLIGSHGAITCSQCYTNYIVSGQHKQAKANYRQERKARIKALPKGK